jgi:hypothetical protein
LAIAYCLLQKTHYLYFFRNFPSGIPFFPPLMLQEATLANGILSPKTMKEKESRCVGLG